MGKKKMSATATFIFLVMAASVLFAVSMVRGQCINKGYELSKKAALIGERKLDLERAEAESSVMLGKKRLFNMANERGFVYMQEGKTYNVEQ